MKVVVSEDILFKQIQEGNKTAFNSLFRLKYTALCRFAQKYLQNESMSEEIVQQVFIRLWDQAPGITITSSLNAYLFQAVRNEALNSIKAEQTRRKYESNFSGLVEIHSEDTINHRQLLAFKKELNNAIDALPYKCKEAFCLSKFGKFSYKEIADIMEVSPKTVENQIGIAFKKLHLLMKHKIAFILENF